MHASDVTSWMPVLVGVVPASRRMCRHWYLWRRRKVSIPRILNDVVDVNYDRRKSVAVNVQSMLGGDVKGKTIGLLGVAFKPNTDDMRDAPAVDIAGDLIKAGAKVRAYDPVAMEVARPMLPDVEFSSDPYEMAKDSDALVVVTEWNEFKQLDLDKIKELLKTPVIYDGRNIYNPARMKEMGFTYQAIGRGSNNK